MIQPIGVNLCKKVLYEKEILISTPKWNFKTTQPCLEAWYSIYIIKKGNWNGRSNSINSTSENGIHANER